MWLKNHSDQNGKDVLKAPFSYFGKKGDR